MFEVGLSTNGSGPIIEVTKACGKAGIKYIELFMSRSDWLDFNLDSYHKLAGDCGVTVRSYHLPFWPDRDLSSPDKAIREETIEAHEDLIARGMAHGTRIFTVHPGTEPIADEERRMRLDISKESLSRLAETAEREGAVLAVEDLPRSCPGHNSEEMIEILNCDERLRSCLDTNHILYESLYDYIDAVGDKIINTHVSDYDLVNERHFLPGEGKVDWQTVIRKLKEHGYSGPWLYEINARSAEGVGGRMYTADDIMHNALEIFEGKKPSLLRNGNWTSDAVSLSE